MKTAGRLFLNTRPSACFHCIHPCFGCACSTLEADETPKRYQSQKASVGGETTEISPFRSHRPGDCIAGGRSANNMLERKQCSTFRPENLPRSDLQASLPRPRRVYWTPRYPCQTARALLWISKSKYQWEHLRVISRKSR